MLQEPLQVRVAAGSSGAMRMRVPRRAVGSSEIPVAIRVVGSLEIPRIHPPVRLAVVSSEARTIKARPRSSARHRRSRSNKLQVARCSGSQLSRRSSQGRFSAASDNSQLETQEAAFLEAILGARLYLARVQETSSRHQRRCYPASNRLIHNRSSSRLRSE